MSHSRDLIRPIVRGAYSLQSLRIQAGNRVCAAFKTKLGQVPSVSEDEALSAEAKKLLDDLRSEYKLLGSAVAQFKKTKGDPKPFEGGTLIESETELVLVEQYLDLEDQEKRAFKRLQSVLDTIPIYTEYLSNIKGIGPAMAAVIVSEIDIHKAKYPSSLHAYAGLDTVTKWVLQKTSVRATNLAKPDPTLHIPTLLDALEHDEKPVPAGAVSVIRQFTNTPPLRLPDAPEGTFVAQPLDQAAIVDYELDGYSIAAEYRAFSYGGRSRKAHHLVEREYMNKDGEIATKRSITFNPWLKSKLVGVLVPSFLRAGNEKYRLVYDNYKHRIEHSDKYRDDSKGHRHAMALRYTAKIFLGELYNVWRPLEGLPIEPTYHEGKLGHKHAA